MDKNESVRNKWIEAKLKEIPKGKKILDAGAGELKWKNACSHLQYVSQDFCEYKGDGDGKALQMGEWDTSKIDIVSDIISIPVDSGSFDAILCSEVFEHIPEPVLAVREFSRILVSGGTLVLTAPFCSLTHFAPYHFSTGYSRYWYERVLDENGFDVKEIVSYGDYYAYLQQEIYRLPSIASKYNQRVFKWNVNRAIQVLGKELEKLYCQKNESDELLCFGYMVLAVKR